MKSNTLTRFVKVFAIAAAIYVFTSLGPTVSAAAMLWCGGGYGLTPDVAVSSAIDDAEISASSNGQFTCTLVGEPEVFLTHNQYRGDFYSASVLMSCS